MSTYLSYDRGASIDGYQLRVIEEYYWSLSLPDVNWPKEAFEESVYMRSAVDDLFKYIIAHQDWTVARSVEEFKSQLESYLMEKESSTSYTKWQMEICLKAVNDVSEILAAMD